MREIKFRFWDTKEKIMYIDPVNLALCPRDRVSELDFEYDDYTGWKGTDHSAHIIPLEYTGLEDGNGVEIYEGDIICCSSGKEDDYLDFRATTGAVEYIAPYFRIGGNELAWCAERLEVIGNIYENKKLLEAR